MSDTVIRVEKLGKKYILKHQKAEKYTVLRDVLARKTVSVRDYVVTGRNKVLRKREDFWALQDISFEVKQGDVVGIIGRNGAGKSTLLKILSRIVEPTIGFAEVRGRIASLLEVGTGFHPELTGRENIFLNGAILGMRKSEISRKFDEIVDFSEVERFLDTPVKRYSSGMYVRLAFAIAAHLEPEILVVDEVLAVGDIAFQQKCLGKMENVASQEGRTVLFVSHNIGSIDALCKSSLVLDGGKAIYRGNIDEAIRLYVESSTSRNISDLRDRRDREGLGRFKATKVRVSESEDNSGDLSKNKRIKIFIKYESKERVRNPRIIIGVYDQMNAGIIRLDTDVSGSFTKLMRASGEIECETEHLNLVPGQYRINLALYQQSILEDYIKDAAQFTVSDSNFFGIGKTFEPRLAKVLIRHSWRIQ
ncbi:ABC transporter ATP-binding protein [cf. Phormidesmis sp. LEGE 11477]|uniref:ABC transporter ATP-binding protein n=1 Tax=cf. Phormidesmis sp. LEGE 11477 TaxID=1828680 RepID=UPI0018810672|nr:ABC transporter ATP-binding protein [cf. Phormidesmis sp. LEGE 11477]MBE9063612.1 ABC transporter ATP-binding protein [cf. Phormidesmis sp. LEGE 11477]